VALPLFALNSNTPASQVDTLFDASGNPKYKLAGPGSVTVAGNDYAPHAVSTHAAGSAIGATDALVAIAGKNGSGNAAPILLDASGRPIIVGAAASGSALAGNPVLVGGSDGTDARSIATDAVGRLITGQWGTDVTGSATGAASALAPALPAVSGKTNYVTGFEVTGAGATAASVIAVTLTGTITGTLNYRIAIPAGATVGIVPLIVVFARPIPASAANTAITLNVASFGAGSTDAAATIHGVVA